MSLAAARARLFSMDLLNVVSLFVDGEWLELRHCPTDTINRAAYEHVHRSRLSRFMLAVLGRQRGLSLGLKLALHQFRGKTPYDIYIYIYIYIGGEDRA